MRFLKVVDGFRLRRFRVLMVSDWDGSRLLDFKNVFDGFRLRPFRVLMVLDWDGSRLLDF